MSATQSLAPTDQDSGYTIAEAAAATGTTCDTLRYYEKAQIMPQIARDSGGRRVYSSDDLGWITFVRRLRSTGMTIQHIADYTKMVREGEGTVAQRRRMIEDHRETVAAAIQELTSVLGVLDRKIIHYEAAERGVDVGCSEEPLRHASQLT